MEHFAGKWKTQTFYLRKKHCFGENLTLLYHLLTFHAFNTEDNRPETFPGFLRKQN